MRFCGACGTALSADGAAAEARTPAKAERRHMTVVFCDVVDSTSLAELLDAEDFRDVLSAYQDVCAREIERFSGVAAQWVGDGVLAYFGYPRAHEDDPLRAVHASLGIVAGIDELNERLLERYGVTLQVRIGINSGTVVAGEMGAGVTRDPLAIVGETPHVAARLQALAPPGSIVVSEVTRDLLGERFATEPLGLRSLKGISREIAVHRILAAVPSPPELLSREAALTPMVNRDHERVRLAEAWEQARLGHGVVAHIAGEAGIGKTRLVRALREDLAEPRSERVLQCSAHHSSTILYPVVRYFEQQMRLESIETPEERLEALEQAVLGAGLEAGEVVPLLADLLEVSREDDLRQPLLARDARNDMLQTIAALLLGTADQHPLLLVVEDLHWADPTTVELLERIVARAEALPVACVLTFREDFEVPWAQARSAVEIELGPLGEEDVRTMATAASSGVLDGDSLRRVQATADGVPLFVEEMVKVLDVAGGERAGPLQISVPPTLQGLLTERLDRLSGLSELIDQAAVLGREFDRRLLRALVPLDVAGFRSAVAQLTSQEVLRTVEGYDSRLEFAHALLQEAAYGRILRQRRRELHARVAETLDARSPLSSEAAPELIAYHWTEAGQHERAFRHWRAAASRAIERAAFLEAAEHLRNALSALDEVHPAPEMDEERASMLEALGRTLQAGRTPASDVSEIFGRGRAACERTGRQDQLVGMLRGESLYHLIRAQYPLARERAAEMVALGDDPRRPQCVAEGHMNLGYVTMYTGRLRDARAHLEEACARFVPAPAGRQPASELAQVIGPTAGAYLAVVLWNLGHTREALQRSEESLALAEQIGGSLSRAAAWSMHTGLLMSQGRMREFGEWLQRALIHATERNIGYWATVCSVWAAWAEARAGRLSAGTARLRERIDEYESTGGRLGLPHFQMLMADVRIAVGDGDAALESLELGRRHVEETGERYYEPDLEWFTARAHMSKRAPDPDLATSAYERAADAARRQDARLLELRALTGLVLHESKLGSASEGLERLAAVCDWFDDDVPLPELDRARSLLESDGAPPRG